MKEDYDLLNICVELSYEATECFPNDGTLGLTSAQTLELRTHYTQLLSVLAIHFLFKTSQSEKIDSFKSNINKYFLEPISWEIIILAFDILDELTFKLDVNGRCHITLGQFTGSNIASVLFPQNYICPDDCELRYSNIILPNFCTSIYTLWDYITGWLD